MTRSRPPVRAALHPPACVGALLAAASLYLGSACLGPGVARAAQGTGPGAASGASAPGVVTVELVGQQGFGAGVGLGVGARLHPGRSSFLSVEARGLVRSRWIGRGTVGLDLFGGWETVDLTAGLFVGMTGAWAPMSVDAAISPTAGLEVGVGLDLGAIRARYRHIDGFAGPLERALTEDEWRVGYQVGRLELFGQALRFNPGDEVPVAGFGLGVAATW